MYNRGIYHKEKKSNINYNIYLPKVQTIATHISTENILPKKYILLPRSKTVQKKHGGKS